MKKKVWLITALACTLIIGATTATYATEGWVQDNSQWVYYNSSDSKLTDTWKKGADDKWRWLNNFGYMATDTLVDNDDYYVDSDGIMLTSAWKQITYNTKANWYYFSDDGKKVTDDWEEINSKWYYFDDTGELQTGWILDDMYYCGSDGVMLMGWQKLYDPDEDESSTSPIVSGSESDDKNWYYFSPTNGKKYVPTLDDSDYGEHKIDSIRYCFDADGALQTGWIDIEGEDSSSSAITDFKYYNDDGSVRTGWYSLEPPENISNNYDNSVEWFYFSSSGVPEASSESDLHSTDVKKINGNSYLFNQYGNPVYGLQKVYIGTGTDEYASYYFGNSSECSIQKGKITVEEGDGEDTVFYFQTSGRGYTGVYDSYLYYYGKLQKAETGTKYQVITITSGSSSTNYVVNTSGKVQKSTSSKDADGVKYTTNSSGVLQEVDDEDVASGTTFEEPDEPIYMD